MREEILLIALTLACWWRGIQLNRDARQSLADPPLAPAAGSVTDTFGRPWQAGRPDAAPLGATADNLFYFVQISDLHVSKFARAGGLTHLTTFVNRTMPFLAPALVVVTGDLTDAKAASKLASHQFEEEWRAYRGALEAGGVLTREAAARDAGRRFWLDLRGNHDTFDVGGWDARENHFRTLSVSQKRTFDYLHAPPFGRYHFVALDGCPDVGPGRPFNFFSLFEARDMDFMAAALAREPLANHTIVLSHYPIADTVFGATSGDRAVGIAALARGVSLWLSGHLHTLVAGIGRTLHAFHEDLQLLDIELGDLKTHALYRIIAVDHDLIAFRDLAQPLPQIPLPAASLPLPAKAQGPVVLVTYPKDARHYIPQHEPRSRISSGSHLRVLVWSSRVLEPSELLVAIDGNPLEGAAKYVGRGASGAPWGLDEASQQSHMPLYVIPWNASRYNDGAAHQLVVTATVDGRSDTHTVPFRLDAAREPLRAGTGEVIMSTHMERFVKDLFLVVYLLVAVGMLLLPRLFYLWKRRRGTWLAYRASTSQRLVKQDARTLRHSFFGRPVPPRKGKVAPPTSSRAWLVAEALLTPSGLRRTAVHLIADLAWFVDAMWFRFAHLAAVTELWLPLFAYALYMTVLPFFWGHLVSSLSPPADAPWDLLLTWRRLQAFYLYGVRLGEIGATHSPAAAYTWIPLLDTWLFAFFEVTYCLGYLTLYLAFVVTPTALLYAPQNERHVRPVHRTFAIRLLVAVCVVYQLTMIVVMGMFYGWESVLFSPGKTFFCLWGAYALYRYLFCARLDLEVRVLDASS